MMDKNAQIITGCAVLIVVAILCAILLRDGADTSGETMAEKPKVSQTPTVETVALPCPEMNPIDLMGPPAPSRQKNVPPPVLKVQAAWADTGKPIEGVEVTLTPLLRISQSKEPLAAVFGVTNKDGRVVLTCPQDTNSSETLMCGMSVQKNGAIPFSFEKELVLLGKTFDAVLRKAYDFHGTVYRRDQTGAFAPAPGAEVSAVDAVYPRMRYSSEDHRSLVGETTYADAQGRYEFQALPFSPVRLWARSGDDSTLTTPAPVQPKHGANSAPFDIYLERGASLSVLVSDRETLKPISDAFIKVAFIGNDLLTGSNTDAEGFCRINGLPIGPVKISANAPGYGSESSPSQVSSDENRNTVPLFLSPGGSVRFHTVDSKTKAPIGNVVIIAVSGAVQKHAITDAQGFALVEGLAVSQVNRVFSMEYKIEYDRKKSIFPARNFKVKPGEILEMELLIVQGLPFRVFREYLWKGERLDIEGEVLSEKGEAVSGALVTACMYDTKRKSSSDGKFGTLTDGSGYFFMESVPFPASVRVDAEGYISQTNIPVEAGTKVQINLVEKKVQELTIRVLNAMTKEPVLDYQVSYVTKNSNGQPKLMRVYSTDGRGILEDVSSEGAFIRSITAEGYFSQQKIISFDEDETEIFLEPHEIVQGIVFDMETCEPVAGIEIWQTTMAPSQIIAPDKSKVTSDKIFFTDSEGHFSFNRTETDCSLFFFPKEYKHFALGLVEIKKYQTGENGELILSIEKTPSASLSVRVFVGMEDWEMPAASGRLRCDTRWWDIEKPVLKEGAVFWDKLPAGKYRLSFNVSVPKSSPVWVTPSFHTLSASFDLSRGEQKSLNLGKGRIATLSGQAYQANGEPLIGKSVSLYTRENSEDGNGMRLNHSYSSYSHAEGDYVIKNIVPGDYVFSISGTSIHQTIQIDGDMVLDWTLPEAPQ